MIRLENDRLALWLSEENGAVIGLQDKRKSLRLIVSDARTVPFRLELEQGFVSEFRSFRWEAESAQDGVERRTLIWEVRPGLCVTGRVELPRDGEEVRFTCEVANESAEPVLSLEYPVIPNLGVITENGESDFVAHSFATGFLVRNPMKHFAADGPGFRFMPYPEGFSGATMQFFAYYGKNRGGLYFAALDGEGYAKWLNFYKNGNGLLEASFIHGCEEIGAAKGLRAPYPCVVRLLEGRDWQEAADLYKTWAERQFWCAGGKLADRDEAEKGVWLLEQTGAATFGVNAGHDRTKWLKTYREAIGTPIFHILGPDWVHTRQNFYNGVPGGLADWFPTTFHPANLACIRGQGDRFAPFEFDYLFNVRGADGDQGREAMQKFPDPDRMKSVDKYKFPLLCPAARYTRELHVERDRRLQREAGVDAIYYDISANNILKHCGDPTHGHPAGAGKTITDAYRDNYIRTKEAMIREAGRYVPMGTEMINEIFLDVLDYYQARAGAQPAAPLEGWPLRDLLKSGAAELIPMFTYVYHEYGPVRLDGWGKLTEEIGSLFYYTVARTYLWGGLYELNYEYSPMEQLDGEENRPDEHYYIFEPRGYKFSDERARYLAQYARLRTGPANKYLAYGKMLRPPAMENDGGKVRLDWFQYNCAKDFKEYNDAGTAAVDAVVRAAWQYRDESVALFFANVTETPREVSFRLDPAQWEVRWSRVLLHRSAEGEAEPFAAAGAPDDAAETGNMRPLDVRLPIPARSVVWLELLP